MKNNKPYSISKARKTKIAGVSVLTCTTKMPGPSFSLPAGESCPNSRGSICDSCYAKKGCYQYATVEHAQDVRFKWTSESMRTEAGRANWIRLMIAAIATCETRYFRGHDSGDFFSVEYVNAWLEVCEQLPGVRFWFPTREYQVKSASPFAIVNPRLEALRKLASLPNVTVRPSALEIGEQPPQVDGMASGSGVDYESAYQCPGRLQDGECRDCRHCWDNPDVPVSYPLH